MKSETIEQNSHQVEAKPKQQVDTKKTVAYWTKFVLIPGYNGTLIKDMHYNLGQITTNRNFFRRLLTFLTLIGFLIIIFVISLAVFSPWIAPFTMEDISKSIFPNTFAPPSATHILGTTQYGWDLYSRIIWGARTSLSAGLYAVCISVIFGTILGLIAAYFGGIVDSILMRIMDLIMAFPGLILAILFITIFGKSLQITLWVVGVLGIPGYTRLVRSVVLQEKEKLYIYTAKVSGEQSFRVIFSEILPNVFSPIIVAFTFNLGGIILGLAGLAYIGLSDPNMVEWGYDIELGRGKLFSAPWAALIPGFMIALTVLGFMLMGDGLRDALDPRIKIK